MNEIDRPALADTRPACAPLTSYQRFGMAMAESANAMRNANREAHAMYKQQEEERRLRETYPALQSAWDAYQVVLKMVLETETDKASLDPERMTLDRIRQHIRQKKMSDEFGLGIDDN